MTARIDEHGCLIVGNCALPAAVVPAVEAFYREQFSGASVVPEEPEGRRWYAACYHDENGSYHNLDSETILREYAEADVKRWKSIEEGEPNGRPDLVVLGTRIEHPWFPASPLEGRSDD